MTNDSEQLFKSRLKALMSKEGWDPKAVAERSGVAKPLVYRWLRDAGGPSLENADKIAKIFGLSTADMISPEQEPSARVERTELSDEIKRAIAESIDRGLERVKAKAGAVTERDALQALTADPLRQKVLLEVANALPPIYQVYLRHLEKAQSEIEEDLELSKKMGIRSRFGSTASVPERLSSSSPKKKKT